MIISQRREYSDYSPLKTINKPDSQKFSFKYLEQNYLLSPSKVQNKSIKGQRDNENRRYIYKHSSLFHHSKSKRQAIAMKFQIRFVALITITSALLSYNGSFGNFIRIPPPKPDQTTTFERTEHSNYFRHAGVVTGVSAYAHLSMEVNFADMRRTAGEICNCYTETSNAIFRDKDLSKNSYRLIKRRIISSNRVCATVHQEIQDVRYGFNEVDSEINLHKDSYEKRQERLRHGRSVNDTRIEEHRREPRAIGAFIGGIIGAVGGYSLASIFGTDFDDSDIWEEIELLRFDDQKLQEQMQWIHAEMEKGKKQTYIREKVEMYTGMMNICEAGITTMALEMRALLNGADSLLRGELGVGLIHHEVLKAKLEAIDREANRRRQNIAVRSINEIFSLPVSIIEKTKDTVTFAIHIPLFELRNQLSLWEYIPMPTYISTNSSVGPGAAYLFQPERKFLGINDDLFYLELDKSDLNECRHFGSTYVCETTVLSRELRRSCLTGLFQGDVATMEKECEIEVIAKGENMIRQIGPHEFAGFFGTPTIVQVSCETYATGRANSKELLGSYRITIPGGCIGSTNTHRFSPIEDLGRFHSLVYVPTDFNLELVLDDLEAPVIEELQNELTTRKTTHFSLFKIKNALRKPLDWITHYPKQIIGYLGALGSAIIAMVIAIPILYFFCIHRKLNQVQENHRVTFSKNTGRRSAIRRALSLDSFKIPSTNTSLTSLPIANVKPESTESIPRPPPDYVASILRSNQ